MKTCENCHHWYCGEDVEDLYPDGYKTCVHPKIEEMISVGYSDNFDFYKDFGCILWEAPRKVR